MNRKIFEAGVALTAAPLAAQGRGDGLGVSGEAAFGQSTRGNTDSTSVNAAFGLVYQMPQWGHEYALAAIQATRDGVATAESYYRPPTRRAAITASAATCSRRSTGVATSSELEVSDMTGFTQSLVTESGSTNTSTESVSSFRARLFGDVALVFSHRIRTHSEVEPGSEETDQFTSIALEYAWWTPGGRGQRRPGPAPSARSADARLADPPRGQ